MSNLSDFQKQIHTYTASSQFVEALAYFKEKKHFFLKSEIASNVFLVADILTCLRKTGAYEAAARFIEIYGIVLNDLLHERIVTAYALVWYDNYKALTAGISETRNTTTSEPVTFNHFIWDKMAEVIPLLARIQSDVARNISNLIAAKLLRTETKRAPYQAKLIRRICEFFEPDQLKTDCFEVERLKKGEVKKSELASLREDWYTHYSKSLYQLEEYEKCIEVCNEALAQFTHLHYSNEVWFSRRIAQCMSKTGQIEKAIEQFGLLLKKKRDWFMYAGLAMLHYQAGDTKKAIQLMHQAITSPGEFNFKVEIIEQLGDMYASAGDNDISAKHYQLAYCIRVSEGWKAEYSLRNKALITTDTVDVKALLRKLIAELSPIWKPLTEIKGTPVNATEKMTGIITKEGIPKEAGKDIWIKAEGGEQLYAFVKRDSVNYQNLNTGVKVQFKVLPALNGKLRKAVSINLYR